MKTQRVVRPTDKGCPPRGPVPGHVVRPEDNNNDDWSAPRTSEFVFEDLCCPPRGHLKRVTRRRALLPEAPKRASKGGRPKTAHEKASETASVPRRRPSNRILRELVDRCISGDCDHATAAKLLKVRRATLDDFIRQAKVERRIERALVAAFHFAFPECDPRLAVTGRDWPAIKTDEMYRVVPAAPCVTYTAEEAARLPPSQPSLLLTLTEPNALNEWSRHPIGRKRNNRDEENGLSCDNSDAEIEPIGAAENVAADVDEADWTALEISGDEFKFAA